MDGEIILDRKNTNVMKLDDSEQALMNEIEIDVPRPRPQPVKKQISQMKTQFVPPQQQVFQEDIDSFANPNKQAQPPVPPPEAPVDYGEYDEPEPEIEYGGDGGGYMMEEEEKPSPGFKTVDEEKADLVNKLGRLEKKGFTVNKRLNAYSPVDELRNEVKRITYSIDVDKSIKFSRRMLIACTTGLEFMNKKYNPFEIQLDGWSENVMENVEDYDEVFEELYVKYRSKMHVAPEIKLIMMLGGSAMMFHLTNSMFKSVMPNMNDVIKQNPGLVQNMVSAVQNTVPKAKQQEQSTTPSTGRHEMQGPGFDISSLMGNIMMPPTPPMNTTSIPAQEPATVVENDDDDDDISDIAEAPATDDVEGDGEVREVKVSQTKAKRGRKKKSVEINL
ncbi:hypothetical protein [Bathycoccus sp. RCC716 virus 1]|uniref:Uncharacterized protein n=1 Tax=Bathycoccus sp. RCC716 virus 1 TaxID=2530038 RepID=A0A7S6SXG9_9PHYC|nr:hypothetical protein [Bathycoccus sp. RCC716 virus 1]